MSGFVPFGVLSPGEEAEQPQSLVDKLFAGLINGTVSVPKKVIDAAAQAPAPGLRREDFTDIPAPMGMTQTWQPGDEMRGAALEAAANVMGGAGIVPAEANSLRMGIKAYHGSPHDFDAFDLSKIGTGEGAQAYGHGLYFAEHEAVAKGYRDTLQGKGFKIPDDVNHLPDEQRRAILSAANAHGAHPDPMEAAKRAQWASPDLRSQPLESIADKITRSRPPDGRMYEVNIAADPANFLDWDAPISGTARSVMANLAETAGKDNWRAKELADNLRGSVGMTGGQAYNSLKKAGRYSDDPQFRNPELALSASLRDAGIPGIRYLDQGSRDAGKGSSNYVVFDDGLINILKKYGLAGAAPVGALLTGFDRGDNL